MDFNFDTGTIYGGIQTIDPTTLPPLGGQASVLTVLGTGAVTLSNGTTAQRPVTPAAAMLRFNSDLTVLEYYNGTTWSQLSVGGGTVTSVAATTTSTGLSITGSPITSNGTFVFTLNAELQGLAGLATTGLVARTGAGTYSPVSITGTAGNISVTDGNGVAGNPTIDLVTLGTPVTASFVKITTDTFGRVSATTPVVTADITALVDGTYVNVAGDTMTGNLTFTGGATVTGLPSPSAGSDAVNKDYADAIANGLSWKTSVIAGTTADITLSGAQTIDGVAVVAGQRVLVKNQTATEDNGIYVVAASAWTRATDMDSTTPVNEINGAAVFVEQGTLNADTAWVQIDDVVTLGTDPVQFVQFAGAGAYTAGNGLTLTGNQFSLTSPVSAANGGTGLNTSTATNGQILIGNGSGLSLSTITAGTAISVTNGAGTITIANTGVTSVAGTANEVTVSASTGAVTIGLPDDVTITNSLTVSTMTPNAAVYVDAGGVLVSTAALTDGQILIGSTGNPPVAGTITAGAGVTVTNAAGSITISADTSTLVSSFSAGTTGFTPNTATTGAVTLAGTLNVANGGTGLTALGAANTVLGVNAAGTAAEYKAVSAGTGISVVNGANVITINNTGVTSVGLVDASTTPIYAVTNSPVTTTGDLTITLNSQNANTVFAAPGGVNGQPSFRGLVYADLPLQLYVETPSTPTPPIVSGTNSVAIGSGSVATADNSFAEGEGANARVFGQKAFANGSFTGAGDAQMGMYVLRNITTDATPTELFLDGTAGTQRLVLPNNSVFTFDILVAARRTDATGGGAAYRFVGAARKDTTSGSITFIGTPSKTLLGETNLAWDVALTTDTTNGAITVTGTGEAAKTIRWVATVQTSEVTN